MNEQDAKNYPSVNDRRIWVRAFYGFDPEGAGYIGFTKPKDQETMLAEMRDGDLVLIYGAAENLTDKHLRAQALGFLEVKVEPCNDRARMSDAAYQWKLDQGFELRWTNGIRVTKAWRIRNNVPIKSIAPDACQNKNRFDRTTRALLLNDHERDRALTQTVCEVCVFGEPPLPSEKEHWVAFEKVWSPTTGPKPSFGKRLSDVADGETQVYLMIYDGASTGLLGRECREQVFKAGRSNEPKRRLTEINAGIPPSSKSRWKLIRAESFDNAGLAHEVETNLKSKMNQEFRSEGGEFFSGQRNEIEKVFSDICISRMHKIRGATAKASDL